ncbi:hypothetical protein BLNAU_13 [Blattamonas nauphoetae]|uniref:Uncharacterized protein n=1 Tax=Blattamonas nauphoetae TaxID=2049346 RepID=A0ABQ9YLS3_9EUKA|nr:hypothetical protein BLNAU_13 [Blattamonas nauphoetae]
MAQPKKKDWLLELTQLQNREKNSMKEIKITFANPSSEFQQLYQTLQKEQESMEIHKKTDLAQIRRTIRSTKARLTELKQLVLSEQIQPSMEDLNARFEIIEQAIFQTKNTMAHEMEDLVGLGDDLENELSLISDRVDEWENEPPMESCLKKKTASQPAHSPVKLRQRLVATPVESIPLDVRAFDDFIASTGRNGGWSNAEHTHFVKMYESYTSHSEMLQVLESMFPTRSKEEIQAHVGWYEHYLTLLERKGIAIQKWKEKKAKQAEKLVKRHEEEQEEAEIDQAKLKKQRQQEEDQRRKKREQVKLWRENKAREQEERERIEEQQRISNEMRQREIERRRKLEIDLSLEQHRRQLELEMKEEKPAVRPASPRRPSSADLARRSEKALESAREKREMLKRRNPNPREAALRAAKPTVVVSSDPSRLLRPTSAFTTRAEQIKEEQKVKDEIRRSGRNTTLSKDSYVLTNQALSIPSWRQGL